MVNEDFDRRQDERVNTNLSTDFDWAAVFDDVELEEDIEQSDEREDINSSKEFINKEKVSYMKFDAEFQKFLCNFVKQQDKKEKQKLYLKAIFFHMHYVGLFYTAHNTGYAYYSFK